MLGIHFEHAKEFGFGMLALGCNLSYSSFLNKNLKNSTFSDCKLIQVDFTGADLSGISLAQCDLKDASFDHTNLKKVDFRGAQSYSIDPEQNQITAAKFSWPEVAGLLTKYNIHIE